jgi:hypothetical protein
MRSSFTATCLSPVFGSAAVLSVTATRQLTVEISDGGVAAVTVGNGGFMFFEQRWTIRLRCSTALCAIAFASVANANQILVNGGFEAGDISGWTVANSTSDLSNWFVTKESCTPLNGYVTAGPASGTYYAVTDEEGVSGPGSHALVQSFAIPLGTTSAVLSFDIFVNDLYGESGSGNVDLLDSGADPLTSTPVQTFYSVDSAPSDWGTSNPYVHFDQDIIGYVTPGHSYQIRFLQIDISPFDVGVDNVSLNLTGEAGTVPEPAMLLPVGFAAGLLLYRRRRRTVSIPDKVTA